MSQTKQIGSHKTTVSTEDGVTKVVYHATTVVKFNRVYIKLSNGGRYTNTTKIRMNQAACQFDLGYKVYQRDLNWFVSYHGQEVEYFDGIVLDRLNKTIHGLIS